MSARCTNGHDSATADYCDQCGVPIGAAHASVDAPVRHLLDEEEADTSPAAPQRPCPACGALHSGDDRYCEECGHDFASASGPRWEAVVAADRHQFERFAATGLAFPDEYVPRRFVLEGETARIGRSRGAQDGSALEIDLAGTPADPGVSRLHAVLERREGGGYSLRDLGSTNGTTVNDEPVAPGTAAVPVGQGDRIRLGAWTMITLRASSEVVPGEHA